ncbi:MAG: MaoC family dehydratase [Burkholderiaceae bacterium]
MKTFADLAALVACEGQEVAVSDWLTIEQADIQRFADATKDWQWIHVQPELAAQTPFGGTIAHGFFTLSLMPYFLESSIRIERCGMSINYGTERVRFPSPLPCGSRLRARFTLGSATPVGAGSYQIAWHVVFEREGGDKPVCVAQALVRLYP